MVEGNGQEGPMTAVAGRWTGLNRAQLLWIYQWMLLINLLVGLHDDAAKMLGANP